MPASSSAACLSRGRPTFPGPPSANGKRKRRRRARDRDARPVAARAGAKLSAAPSHRTRRA
eukprot:984831-Pyramimonas_sp.AAC.1